MGQSAPDKIPDSRAAPEAPLRRPAWQQVCIALALLLLVGGPAAVLLARRPHPRPRRAMPMPPAPSTITQPPLVIVRIARSNDDLFVDCPGGGGTWYAGAEEGRRLVAAGAGPWIVGSRNGRLTLDKQELPEPAMELYCADGLFRLEGRTYRGSLALKAGRNGELTALNSVGSRDYLRSVVGSETYRNWPLDALMAQAVAARTFMLHTLRSRDHLSLYDMAYKGVRAESGSAELAVGLTAGIVLTHDAKLLPAYFHSTCGGHTAPADKVFAEEPIGPLQGVACQWCQSSPTYRWTAEIPAYRIAQSLRERGVAQVRSISPAGTGADGYARFVDIAAPGAPNGPIRMAANAFRRAVAPGLLKSTCFTVTAQGNRFVFQGRGHGHGVGLCQWGAWGLAVAGKTWEQILQHYYPGAVLQKIRQRP